jgi:hypothetical protein
MTDINKLKVGSRAGDLCRLYGAFHSKYKNSSFNSIGYIFISHHIIRYVSADYILTSSKWYDGVSLILNPGQNEFTE